jgi:hypothetical protein
MTIEEFNQTQFTGSMQCIFKAKTRDLFSISVDQALIGLVEDCQGSEAGDIEWVRCENVELINNIM